MVQKESDGSTPRSNCSEEDEEDEDGSSPECGGIPMTTFLTPPEEQNGKWKEGCLMYRESLKGGPQVA